MNDKARQGVLSSQSLPMFQGSYRRLYLPISSQSSLDLRLAIGKGERVGGGVEQEVGVSRC